MAPDTLTGFANRLAYARLAYLFRTGTHPGNAEIAREADRTGEWLGKWIKDDMPPSDFNVYEPIATFLDVDWRWLFRGQGEPPNPDLWQLWRAQQLAREKEPRRAKVAEPIPSRRGPAAKKGRAREA